MPDKWAIEIKEHPYVKDNSYEYDRLEDMERFVGNNDIQVDQIKSVTHHSGFTGRDNIYTCIDLVSVRSLRLLLVRTEDPGA